MPNYEDREAYPDALLFRVAEEFIGQGRATGEVADRVMREFSPPRRITRETIYPLLTEAIRREFVRLVPPVNQSLAEKLEKRFPGFVVAKWTRVVEPAAQGDDDKVSEVAAQLVLETLEEVKVGHDPTRPIGLGLGPGRATLDFCRHLSRLIRHNPEVPDLSLVAIAGGGSPYVPEYSPTSFFNLFPRELFSRGKYANPDVRRQIGLFAESMVPVKDIDELKDRLGVREAFQHKKSIDVVVTAMGDMYDPDDLLANFLTESGQNLEELQRQGWIGNVQYRPYSATGPIKEKDRDMPRVVTLFELHELVEMSKEAAKRVVLIARRCGRCGRTRAQALRPLLTQPKLKVFSRLVLDAATAIDLLKD